MTRFWCALVVGLSMPLCGDAAVYYLDLADTSVTQDLNLDLVPGWAPGQPWEFRLANPTATQTFLLVNQLGFPEPGNRVLSVNAPVCPEVVSGSYQIEAIPVAEGEMIGPHPMPVTSFSEIGVPYWSAMALLRNGPESCVVTPRREPTLWELLASGERRYAGLLLQVDGELHYGWLALNVGSLLIDDFAYEQVPDRPIRAGDTVPEPAAVFASCAAFSVLAWRRLRRARAYTGRGRRSRC